MGFSFYVLLSQKNALRQVPSEYNEALYLPIAPGNRVLADGLGLGGISQEAPPMA